MASQVEHIMEINNVVSLDFNEYQKINVPIDPSINIEGVTSGDDDPKFVNVEVVRAGISGNNRRYNNQDVNEVNALLPGTEGYLGHPDPSKSSFEFREPQCIYVGGTVEQMADGISRCIGKCYLFKTSPLRMWVPASIAAGKPMTVSINATADVMVNNGIIDVVHVSTLDSVDWANPGTEGMDTSQAMSVVNEMKNNLGGKAMAETITNSKEVITGASVQEIRAYNPTACSAIVAGITIQELQQTNPTLYNQIVEAGKITEMNLKIGGQDKAVKITEMQGIITENEATINTLNAQITGMKLTEYKNKKINEQVPEQFRDKIAARISGNTEADIDKSIETEVAYVREMVGGMDNIPAPHNSRTKDAIYGDVAAMFGAKPPKAE